MESFKITGFNLSAKPISIILLTAVQNSVLDEWIIRISNGCEMWIETFITSQGNRSTFRGSLIDGNLNLYR